MTVTEKHNRRFKKLRVSLTNQCNFNCIYCVGKEHLSGAVVPSSRYQEAPGKHELRLHEYKQIIEALHRQCLLEELRLTGGEPLLSPYAIDLIRFAKQLGIPKVGLTTNGFYLDTKLDALAKSGLDSLNISLDAIDNEMIKKMAGISNAHLVKDSIVLAQIAGLNIKLNAVIMKGRNESEILPLLEFARRHNITLRYIEFMGMGHLHGAASRFLVPQDELLAVIGSHYTLIPEKREPGATAQYWQLAEGGRFGIIANYSAPFCSDCNRLRLDSTGKLYGCLSANKGFDVKSITNDAAQFTETLHLAMAQKQPIAFSGSSLSMKYIGG